MGAGVDIAVSSGLSELETGRGAIGEEAWNYKCSRAKPGSFAPVT